MKKIVFILLLVIIVCGGVYGAVHFLRDDPEPAPLIDDTGSSSSASSAISQARIDDDIYFTFGASLLKDFPTDTIEDKIKQLRIYNKMNPIVRNKVKSGLARNLVSLSQRDRLVFEVKILEAYLALPLEERKASKAAFIDLFASMPDSVISEPPLATAPLVRGSFVAGSGTTVTGDILLSIDPGTGINLRLENFRVSKAPDLHLYLTKVAEPKAQADFASAFIDLGTLKGNAGNQNYMIPSDTPVQEFTTLVIYSPGLDSVHASASTK